jgi:hypothetical protein
MLQKANTRARAQKPIRVCRARAGPGVSPASPWARATPHPRATKREKKKFIHIHPKKKKKICIYKIKFLLEGKIKNNHNPMGKIIFKRQKKNIQGQK